MSVRYFFVAGGLSSLVARMVEPIMTFRGVRMSWLIRDRKSVFARPASFSLTTLRFRFRLARLIQMMLNAIIAISRKAIENVKRRSLPSPRKDATGTLVTQYQLAPVTGDAMKTQSRPVLSLK